MTLAEQDKRRQQGLAKFMDHIDAARRNVDALTLRFSSAAPRPAGFCAPCAPLAASGGGPQPGLAGRQHPPGLAPPASQAAAPGLQQPQTAAPEAGSGRYAPFELAEGRHALLQIDNWDGHSYIQPIHLASLSIFLPEVCGLGQDCLPLPDADWQPVWRKYYEYYKAWSRFFDAVAVPLAACEGLSAECGGGRARETAQNMLRRACTSAKWVVTEYLFGGSASTLDWRDGATLKENEERVACFFGAMRELGEMVMKADRLAAMQAAQASQAAGGRGRKSGGRGRSARRPPISAAAQNECRRLWNSRAKYPIEGNINYRRNVFAYFSSHNMLPKEITDETDFARALDAARHRRG